MQFEKLKINISVNNEVYTFYYSCNQAATFSDLLEYFSYLCPNLNICKWYQFYSAQDNKNIDQSCIYISHQTKIENFKKFLGDILLKKNQNKCEHNKLNFLLSSKKVIIPYFQNIIFQKDKEIEQNKIRISTLDKEIEQYKSRKNTLDKEIEDYKTRINILDKEIEDYKIWLNSLEENISKSVLLKEPINKEQINFYDVIIHIDSVKDINKGWKIEMSEKGKHNYDNYKNEKILKLGVIGNANKGKSYLLSKISNIDLPSGMSIKTQGLSIKYPALKYRKIALLDSAVFEAPVLISDIQMEKREKEKNGEKEEIEKIGAKDKIGETEKNELSEEKSKEKLITELFLQNYIVNNSDILLVVVDCLSYSEQKLLMKIKKEIERANKISHLYVIHNLKTYTSIKQIEHYIDKNY